MGAKDSAGAEDPLVSVCFEGKVLQKSRTLEREEERGGRGRSQSLGGIFSEQRDAV